MCNLSKNLKLCSCETDIEKLKHYWVVHRKKTKSEFNEIIIGQADFPVFLEKEIEIHNETLLLHLSWFHKEQESGKIKNAF
ncbi:hypothetical protein [Formosa sp. S-31]|uniref:hypothetical protein n=1 Tax=Formosa sp. S-31 TaxID=2790949 RepID=UPI003EBF708A